ncbi:MAG: LON peptidase substrate-binding domain-containing protein [Planctomycetota bacterium]
MSQFELESRSGLVPLFPLPDNCLLPGELQSFHIFEPRYRSMLSAALASDRLIALPRFRPGWPEAYYCNPEVEHRFGVGKIVSEVTLPDGTSDIVLRGIARVRLLEVVRSAPYRLARVAELPDSVADTAQLEWVQEELCRLLAREASDVSSPCYRAGLPAGPVTELAGRLARLVRFDPTTKQRMLEADDLADRLGLLLTCLCSGRCRSREIARPGPIRARKPFAN